MEIDLNMSMMALSVIINYNHDECMGFWTVGSDNIKYIRVSIPEYTLI